MLLAVDVGNSNVTLGAFEKDRLSGFWRLATDERKTADEYGTAILSCLKHGGSSIPGIEAVSMASVVPSLSLVFERMSVRYLGKKPFWVGAETPLGLKYKVDRPREVGGDRVANALAVLRFYGGPAVVVDFGTATTFDCVSGKGEYLGGAILIGAQTAARALSEYTARLPRVEIKRVRRVVGKNTEECIQAGLFFGYLGMVDRVLRETLKELGGRPRLLATGGLADIFVPYLDEDVTLVPDLTLQGLRLAYEGVVQKSGARV